ncbi:hypothetical protein L0F63_002774 [Massospora cicadina]|nr:hypothetical protein L0F63_002774 [Massospora cicadina]
MSTQVTLDDGFKTSRVIHVSHYIPSICRPPTAKTSTGYVGRCLDETDATLCHDLSDRG